MRTNEDQAGEDLNEFIRLINALRIADHSRFGGDAPKPITRRQLEMSIEYFTATCNHIETILVSLGCNFAFSGVLRRNGYRIVKA